MTDGAENLLALLDSFLPGRHTLAVVLVLMIVFGIPILLRLGAFGFQWRKDRRDDRANITALMGLLVDKQAAELNRLVGEGEALRKQIDTFVEGRWQLQRALDDLREQMIAARVTMHDYERRLGLPETTFPPLPSMAVIPRVS